MCYDRGFCRYSVFWTSFVTVENKSEFVQKSGANTEIGKIMRSRT